MLRLSLIAITVAVISGCASVNNYDTANSNPFDEPRPAPQQRQVLPKPTNPARFMHSAKVATMSPADAPDVVVTPVQSTAPLEVQSLTQLNGSELTASGEMLDEAARLGRIGDVQGKADVLLQAGNSGSGAALYELAKMYQDGTLPKDEEVMVGYLVQAQNLGHVEATRVLGHLYCLGQSVPLNLEYGKKLLESAARTSTRAAREYGMMLTNQRKPYLNDQLQGIEYLQKATDAGDQDAARSLAAALKEAGRSEDALVALAKAEEMEPAPAAPRAPQTLSARAHSGDVNSVFSYAQQLLLRKIPTPEPEFNAYCWFAVAKEMGHPDAAREMGAISGVRLISDKQNPGRLDRCIADLQQDLYSHR